MCECDLQFAQYMGLRASSWDTKNSGVHSNWQPEEQCLEETGANYHGKCCVNPLTGLTSRFNSLTKCCDAEGLIHEQGQCIGEQTISTDGQSLWSG
ncbi:unnamed protein product [Oikopleura dioica]|uniref:Uncharacterized protein n=1 Tax=Oikopleura dioica TaxID=34765 RepID=E4WQR8_OIKDI|nr:unnamed protein product [Oikopleura dioica]